MAGVFRRVDRPPSQIVTQAYKTAANRLNPGRVISSKALQFRSTDKRKSNPSRRFKLLKTLIALAVAAGFASASFAQTAAPAPAAAPAAKAAVAAPAAAEKKVEAQKAAEPMKAEAAKTDTAKAGAKPAKAKKRAKKPAAPAAAPAATPAPTAPASK
jgi:large subunit ribosomal protein L22e/colicin import membrane protein